MKKTKKNVFFEKKIKLPKTSQNSIPFIEAYDNGLFLVGEDKYTLIFSFENIDYALLRDVEKQDIYEKYSKLMNSLPSDINYQEFIMNSKINSEMLEQALIPKERKHGAVFDDYCSIQKGVIKNAEQASAEKIMLIAMSYTPQSNIDNVNVLFKYYREIQVFFENLKIKTRQLMPEEVFKVLHEFYNPYENNEFLLPNNLWKKGSSIKDYIAPSHFTYKNKHAEVGMNFTRVLFLKQYDREINDEFIKDIIDNNLKVTLSKHLKRVEKSVAIDKVKKEIFDIQTQIQKRKHNNKKDGTDFIPFRHLEKLRELEELQNHLSTSNMELFEVSVFVSVSAKTESELDETTQFIINKARKHQVKLDVLVRQQEKAIHTVLPFGNNKFDSKFGNELTTYLLTDATAVLVPFSYCSYFNMQGISYGTNLLTSSTVVLDRTEEMNSNSFILGTSGSGKSMFIKSEIADVLFKYPNDEIIVIDPENEYSKLAQGMDGEVIKIAANSNTSFNFFDIDLTYSEGAMNAIGLKAEFILTIVETAKGSKLTAEERSIVDRCVHKAYSKYEKTLNDEDLPNLKIFHEILLSSPEKEASQIALILEIYAKGSLQCFAGNTNIELSKKLLIFDIFDMGEQLRAVGLQVILEFLWQRVIANKKKGIRTWLWVDEFSIMFNDGPGRDTFKSGEFFSQVFKRIRKHGGVATGATQNIKEVLDSKQAASMLANSEFLILLQQKASELNAITSLFELSPSQELFLKTGERGTGLIICGQKIIPFSKKIPKGIFYDLITTKFNDEKSEQKKEKIIFNLPVNIIEDIKHYSKLKELTEEELLELAIKSIRTGV